MNIKMTLEEAVMVQDMDGAIREGWINITTPTFTARALAIAVENTVGRGVDVERKLSALLDRMGVFMDRKTYRRQTRELLEILPEWCREASRERERRGRETGGETERNQPSRHDFILRVNG